MSNAKEDAGRNLLTLVAGAYHHPEWLYDIPILPTEVFKAHPGGLALWLGITKCIRDKRPVTIEAVREGAGALGKYVNDGNYGFLSEYDPLRSDFLRVYNSVVESDRKAKLTRTLSEASERLAKGEGAGHVLSSILGPLARLGEASFKGSPQRIGDLARAHVQVLEDRMNGKRQGIMTGLVDLDSILMGLKGGDLVIVAGRPGMGKSVLGVHIAMEVAKKDAALVLSMEMQAAQVLDRLLANEAHQQGTNLSVDQVAAGKFSQGDFEKLTQGVNSLSNRKLWIDDTGGLSIHAIMAKARHLHAKENIKVLVVDYLQLATGTRDSRREEVGEISNSLKLLAKDLDIPVIALAQLNRSCEQRVDKRPILSDLRESGDLEQDADVVCMTYRDDYYNPDSTMKNIVEVIVRKNRQGRTGTAYCAFQGERSFIGNSTYKPGSVVPMRNGRGFDDGTRNIYG